MTTFHLDYVNGNDANAGTSWATAWKTLTNGATAARTNPGDLIKIAKSPDPTATGVDGTFTDMSYDVTTSAPLVKTVWNPGNGNWVAATNVTRSSLSTYYKSPQGYSETLTPATAFVTGKAGYFTFAGVQDFSAYQQLSLQIRTSAQFSNSAMRICLCSDATGDVVVNSFTMSMAHLGQANFLSMALLMPLTFDYGAPLGASIQSVAVYFDTDPGTPQIGIGSIVACKAPSDPASVTYSSLIGRSGDALSDEWYAIRYLDGLTNKLWLECTALSVAPSTTLRGFNGVSGTYPIYKRETTKTALVTATTTVVQSINEGGTSEGARITYSGGWNAATDTLDGMTVFDGTNSYGLGINTTTVRDYVTLTGISYVRYNTGLNYSANGSQYVNVNIPFATSNARGVNLYGLGFSNVVVGRAHNNGSSSGVVFYGHQTASVVRPNTLVVGDASCNIGGGVYLSYWVASSAVVGSANYNYAGGVDLYYAYGSTLQLGESKLPRYYNITATYTSGCVVNVTGTLSNNTNNQAAFYAYQSRDLELTAPDIQATASSTYGVYISDCVTVRLYLSSYLGNPLSTRGAVFSDSGTADVTVYNMAVTTAGTCDHVYYGTQVTYVNCSMNPLSVYWDTNTYSLQQNTPITFVNVNNDPDNHAIVYSGAAAVTDKVFTHSGGNYSWKLTQLTTNRPLYLNSFVPLKVATVAVDDQSKVRITAWIYKTSAAFTARLVCLKHQLPGMARAEAVASAAFGVWEQLTLDVYPSSVGVIEFHVEAYGAAVNQWVYVDDVEIGYAP